MRIITFTALLTNANALRIFINEHCQFIQNYGPRYLLIMKFKIKS